LRYNLEMDLALSIGITLLVTLSVYIAIHRLVVRPVETFRSPLARFASGNFTSRLPQPQTPTDELGELAHTFNRMAEELEQRAREREEREELRQRAIAEERGRVARELHDGLAQLLGYVTTKAMAVRLMLSKHQLEAADKTLLQLEEAARELLVDVREAISDLKATGQKPAGLAGALQECTAQFSRISGVSVQMSMDLANAELSLPTETELHLLRIVQEALANVYKHASASGVHVTLEAGNGLLKLVLSDDGKGFSQESTRTNQRSHFGLESMRERAQEIGAEFMLDSKPGFGTQITVRLPLEGSS
jgi:signal transduction histidine kinase